MDVYRVSLLEKNEVAAGTIAFYFEKPAEFTFKPGQYISLILNKPVDSQTPSLEHDFSLASAPYENQLMITTRMRDSEYKNFLKSLSLGTAVEVKGPLGAFALSSDQSKPAVLLAGGIGITPFRSIVIQAVNDNDPRQIYLFYSNRLPEDAAFLEELAQVKNPNFHFVPTMTQADKLTEKWNGERGYINKGMLSKYISDLSQPIYHIAGQPDMVTALKQMLLTAGVTQPQIRSEAFAGY